MCVDDVMRKQPLSYSIETGKGITLTVSLELPAAKLIVGAKYTAITTINIIVTRTSLLISGINLVKFIMLQASPKNGIDNISTDFEIYILYQISFIRTIAFSMNHFLVR
jgi:hypothetical protein